MYLYSPSSGLWRYQEVPDHIENLWALANELEALNRGERMSVEDLRDAPLIDNWAIVCRPVPAMMGKITNHPTLSNIAPVSLSSEVIVDGREVGWVRTGSRYYRLGTPLLDPQALNRLPLPPWPPRSTRR
jgi:hypothetical protein